MATSFMEKVQIVTAAVRTVLAAVVVGALGWGGWYGYTVYNARDLEMQRTADELAQARQQLSDTETALQTSTARVAEQDQQITALHVQVDEQRREIERLDMAMRLLKVDHRLARLTVIDQQKDDAGQVTTVVRFQELSDRNEPIGQPQSFTIAGDIVYVDSWVVKFDDKYVEQNELDRGTSLVLFRRIFGEQQEPRQGFALDEAGTRPTVYGRDGKMSDFERRIWDDFWSVANDEDKQKELGIRAAHGEAPSIKVAPGGCYRLELRASAGLTVRPDSPPAGPAT